MSATAQTNGRGRAPRVPLINPAPEPAPSAPASVATPSLDAAVLRVQAKAGKLIRNADGQVQSRSYRYVTLTAVVDEVLPLLVEEDLLWKVFPTTTADGRPGLRYSMTHVPTGERDEDELPLLVDPTMQALGSGITYGRRYALVSYLGLTVDEDDDGAGANTPVAATPAGQTVDCARPTARPPARSERPATAPQRKMLRAKAAAAQLSAEAFADVINAAGDGEPIAWSDAAAAQRWTDRALERLPASLVDAVILGIERSRP